MTHSLNDILADMLEQVSERDPIVDAIDGRHDVLAHDLEQLKAISSAMDGTCWDTPDMPLHEMGELPHELTVNSQRPELAIPLTPIPPSWLANAYKRRKGRKARIGATKANTVVVLPDGPEYVDTAKMRDDMTEGESAMFENVEGMSVSNASPAIID